MGQRSDQTELDDFASDESSALFVRFPSRLEVLTVCCIALALYLGASVADVLLVAAGIWLDRLAR